MSATTGNDSLVGTIGDDTIDGLAGDDTIFGYDGLDPIMDGSDSLFGGLGFDLIFGGAGDDTLDGGDDNDTLEGDDGNDVLNGGAGDDALDGGAGFDTIDGGVGFDFVQLSWTATTFSVGGFDPAGNGVTASSDFADSVSIFNAELVDFGGNFGILEFALGGTGNDSLTAVSGFAAQLYAGSGDDTVAGGTNDDVLDGSFGADQLDGGAGNDFIQGDVLVGAAAADTLTGGAGNDSFFGDAAGLDGDTITDFDAGDVISIQGAAFSISNVFVSSTPTSTTLDIDADNDGFADFTLTLLGDFTGETFLAADNGFGQTEITLKVPQVGTAGADFIDGTADDDTILGLEGADTLNGLAGHDSLEGGDGFDVLTGGAGDDTMTGGAGFDAFVVDPVSGSLGDVDHITDFEAGDSISIGEFLNTLPADVPDLFLTFVGTAAFGGAAGEVRYSTAVGSTTIEVDLDGDTVTDYTLVIDNGAFTIRQTAEYFTGLEIDAPYGAATIDDDNIGGTSGGDSLDGGDGDDFIDGVGGDDTLIGGAGVDVLFGRDGHDLLSGGDDNDELEGGTGNDTLDGGAGVDNATFSRSGPLNYIITDTSVTELNSGDVTSLVGIETITFSQRFVAPASNDIFDASAATIGILVFAGGGDDVIIGGSGDDFNLEGDTGRDTLTGGAGADLFDFDLLTEFDSVGDLVTDLEIGDVLDFQSIHQFAGLPGGLVLTYIGNAAFSGAVGELRWSHSGGNTIVEIDSDGDMTGDHRVTVTNGEFILEEKNFAGSFRLGIVADDFGASVGDHGVLSFAGGIASVVGETDFAADEDWFAIDLVAGVTYNFDLTGFLSAGGANGDPILRLYNNNGVLVAENDNHLAIPSDPTGPFTLESFIQYTATLTGTFFISAGGGDGITGSYQLNAVDLGVLTANQIAGSPFADLRTGSSSGDVIDTFAGDDTIDGAGGNDVIHGGDGFDFIDGGSGHDTIYGDVGNDTLNGGNGNDVFFLTAGDEDFIDGGAGIDKVVTTEPFFNFFFSMFPTPDFMLANPVGSGIFAHTSNVEIFELSSGTQFEILQGQIGVNNTLTASMGLRVVAVAAAGDDTITGSAGRDFIFGGDGADVLTGNGGNDVFSDYTGLPFNFAGDTITDFDADDSIWISADLAPDQVAFIASATETLVEIDLDGDTFVDLSFTLLGDYTGVVQNFSVNNTSPQFTVISFAPQQTVGTSGNDVLTGDSGDDALSGLDGDDRLDGRAGADALDGGAGFDIAAYTASSGAVSIDLAAGTASGGDAAGDTLTGIEGVIGSNFGDTLVGSAAAELLSGGGGSDQLSAGGGNDTVDGGLGNDAIDAGDGDDLVTGQAGRDTILGGAGNDSVDAAAGDDSVDGGGNQDNLFGGAGADTLLGNNGNDTLAGGTENDVLAGGGGFDFVLGQEGSDQLFGDALSDTLLGGDGNDTLSGGIDNDRLFGEAQRDLISGDDGDDIIDAGTGDDTVDGGNQRDSVFGGSGFDLISGGNGNDTLTGGTNGDTLNGGAGFDVLQGDAGDDVLNGGASNDVIFGNAGNDTIVFNLGGGTDTLRDFTSGAASEDVISLTGFGAAFDSFAEVIGAAAQTGNHVTIDFGNGDMLVIRNTLVASLHADDFAFG